MHLTEEDLRFFRGLALKDTDWTQMPDSPLSAEKKAELAQFRQDLRDLTKHENWPNITLDDFPVDPGIK